MELKLPPLAETGETLTGAEIVIRCLQAEGVEHVFGYPGGAVLHIYDAIFQQKNVKHVLVRHEQGALHAADGYARATGKPGVALVTSGPGVTNAVTGIATAYMDSIPMVVITGQVPTRAIGEDAFQECDTVGITRPTVKHNFLVKDVNELATTIKKAFHIATTGRPGPVLVDIPKDISAQKTHFHYPEKMHMRSYNPVTKGHGGQIKKALSLLLDAKRPMIYVGGGAILGEASEEVRELVRLLGYPVTNTLMGLGSYPANDKQFLGMLGMHGTIEANMAMQNSDVLLAIGARFDDRVIGNPAHFAAGNPTRKIIHIDVDPSSISKRVRVDVPIVGGVKEVLHELLPLIKASAQKPDAAALAAWWEQIAGWRAQKSLKYDRNSPLIKPQSVIEKLYEVTKGDAYITSDVGQHQMWAAQFYRFDKPRRWINSGGLGTMGVGLPYAMGVKIVNLNNRYMGMVRQWQEFFHGNRYSESYMDALPDFVKLAEAYGHVGMRIDKPADVEGALKEAFAMKDRLVFMDFITDQTENVFPMVPGGKGMSEMILSEEL
jgi:acetolactate synthase-1/2/3 large subunit